MALGDEFRGVIVLYNQSQGLIKGEPQDMLAEVEVIDCANRIAEALAKNYNVISVPIHADVETAMASYSPADWVVFNLGEGFEGRLFECARIAWFLEARGFHFTGAGGDALARTTHKAVTKLIVQQAGLRTPPGWLFRHVGEVKGEFPYPMIVKPVAEDASLGIDRHAVVNDLEDLKKRVSYVVDHYQQAALVEKFIVGREFNISLWGEPAELLPLDEIDFSSFSDPLDRIISFAAKWDTSSFEYTHTPGICPAPVNDALALALQATALQTWQATGCRGYARIDMRVEENQGLPFVIEVNCNPDLSPEAGFFRAAKTAGYSFEEMVDFILDLALPKEGSKSMSFSLSENMQINKNRIS